MMETARDNPDNVVLARTRVDVVMDALRERIAGRSLMPGARVPSIRAMTETLGVSKSTVVEASRGGRYDRRAPRLGVFCLRSCAAAGAG
jgi:hypothetical protein